MQNLKCSHEMAKSISFLIIGCLFFASGFSSLIYQVVWSRLLAFVFGSTTFATASVLAVFMGGLALGSFLSGKFSDRVRNPLIFYGILEGIIGLWALAVPSLLDSAVPLYRIVWQQYHLSPLLFALLRLAVAGAVLILPTACMGATLPFVSRYVATNADTLGSRLGTLYAVNTFGAVFGAALAGFLLLPWLGLKMTTWVAAFINLILFLAVFALSARRRQPALPAPAEVAAAPVAGGRSARLSGTMFAALSAFGISGALSMAYEVGFTRALLLVIGSGTYAFTCMLTTFLLGIFLGSWLCARVIDKSKDAFLVFAALEIAAAFCALAALLSFAYLPVCNLVVAAFLAQSAETALVLKFVLAAFTFVPLTLCLGATFPAVVSACVKDLASVGRSVGTLYSANTCGAIVGAFLSGFVLVPFLGVEKMLLALAVLSLLLGCVLLFLSPTAKPVFRFSGMALTVCLAFLAAFTPQVWDHRLLLLVQPLRRNHSDPKSVAAILFDAQLRRQALSLIDVLYYADGISSNVGVVKMKDTARLLLLTNGNVDGGDSLDMGTQILLSLFPFMVKPDIQDVCVVGYGTGISTGTALCFPVKHVDSIELEKKVYDAARYFDHVNHRPDSDTRSHFEMEDGRNFLLTTDRKFDLIVSEPSNPWQAGVCNLYTREYFEICHRHLKPGGLMSCWLQTTELSPASIRSILSAQRSSFPHLLVFGTGKGPDVVILAGDSPLQADWKTIKEAFRRSPVKLQFDRAGLLTPVEVAACIKADTQTAAAICGDSLPNSDDRNYLEFAVCKTYETSNFESDNRQLFDNNPVQLSDVLAPDRSEAAPGSDLPVCLAESALEMKRPRQALAFVSGQNENPRALCAAGDACWQMGERRQAGELFQKALQIRADDDLALAWLARLAVAQGQAGQAVDYCHKALRANEANCFAQYFLGLFAGAPAQAIALVADQDLRQTVLCRVSDPETVKKHLQPVCQDQNFLLQYPNALYMAALAEMQTGDAQAAERLLSRFVQLKPAAIQGKRTLAQVLYSRGKMLDAACLWTASFDDARRQSQDLTEQAEKLRASGQYIPAYDQLVKALELCPANYKALFQLQSITDKVPQSKNVLQVIQSTGAGAAALQAQRIFQPPDDRLSKITEIVAAGFLLWLALRRRPGKKDKQT